MLVQRPEPDAAATGEVRGGLSTRVVCCENGNEKSGMQDPSSTPERVQDLANVDGHWGFRSSRSPASDLSWPLSSLEFSL